MRSKINVKMYIRNDDQSLSRLYHDRQLTGASMQNVKPHCTAVSFAATKVITRTANNVKNMILNLLIVNYNIATNELSVKKQREHSWYPVGPDFRNAEKPVSLTNDYFFHERFRSRSGKSQFTSGLKIKTFRQNDFTKSRQL